ncbi:hypothetical protein J2Z83_000755 [Virgibacillus natechei]|uniref:Uncharacterized protein n=1 Tax=Virgibacillus natechei TaxID=1216297 RepID=A0ABS4ICS7_9BACI|nr:hypothetical protein [Virgibacillus natechei]MBP1968663.1 hypothetical protein [Virgibacillus natechei]UZD13767.1 hypothetical protein OLD84_04225 [Virgibacillus natechei]
MRLIAGILQGLLMNWWMVSIKIIEDQEDAATSMYPVGPFD